jgi:GGDEF domain-containing protein
LALQERPHILITEWEMPGMGGIGVAARDESTPDIEALIERADAGAYLAKQFGRNRVASIQSKNMF